MSEYPPITCLCPTYGRFTLLRRALACFLAQDYAGKKRLLILSDAQRSLQLESTWHAFDIPCEGFSEPLCATENHLGVTTLEAPGHFTNLGAKRQALLLAAETPLVAHWDDDDVYLPWHLRVMVEALTGRVRAVKVRRAWVLEDGRITGAHGAGNDASMVFDRQAALMVGGYPADQVGQNIRLLEKFKAAGLYAHVDQGEMLSYVYRGRPGAPGHNMAARSAAAFKAQNTDFGDGSPLTPAALTPLWDRIARDLSGKVSTETLCAIGPLLQQSLERIRARV